ncbi:hypothetical protein DCC62_22850 [candidate division KSB1 bacterium]|nr:MAG: hypothetical protein DCC62_22850 [candidate division KSB1 bacterium]
MNTDLEIKTYIGVGNVRFGMKPEEVAKVFGTPDKTTKNFLKEKIEYRNKSGLVATYSLTDGSLIELGFRPIILSLRFKGIRIFEDPYDEVFKKLLHEDSNPYQSLGIVVLLNLGIALTGFLQEDEDDRSVTIFSKGRWDFLKEELEPFRSKV